MAVRAKSRRSSASKRSPVAVASRPARSSRPVRSATKARDLKPIKREVVRRNEHLLDRKTAPFPQLKLPAAVPAPGHGFAKALRYLDTLTDFERLRIVRYNNQNFDLERMRTLLRRLGNPQDAFKAIHVAGTKGKGSTCAMIASMLQANDYKVGLYTSPHL